MTRVEGQYTVTLWGNAEPPTELVLQLRNPNRKYGGGLRTGTGGHFDPTKDKSMEESARRELTEEVPELAGSPLTELARCRSTTESPDETLFYKTFYYFWGGILPTDKPLPECDPNEGTLEWVAIVDLPSKNLFPTTLAVLKEWGKRRYSVTARWTQYVHGVEDEKGITRQVATDRVEEGLQELSLD